MIVREIREGGGRKEPTNQKCSEWREKRIN